MLGWWAKPNVMVEVLSAALFLLIWQTNTNKKKGCIMPTKINYIKPVLLIMKHNFQLQAWWIFWLDSHDCYHECLTSIKWHTFVIHFLLFTVVKICTFYTWGVKFQIHTGRSFANGKSLRNQLRNIISFCTDQVWQTQEWYLKQVWIQNTHSYSSLHIFELFFPYFLWGIHGISRAISRK